MEARYAQYARDKKYVSYVQPILDEYLSRIPYMTGSTDDTIRDLCELVIVSELPLSYVPQKQFGVICPSWNKNVPYGYTMIVTDRHDMKTKYILQFVSTYPRMVFWKGDLKICIYDMKSYKDTHKTISDLIEYAFIKMLISSYFFKSGNAS